MAKLTQKLKTLPQKPGVYMFKDNSGEILYVGKAKNLKNRVRSYFQKARDLEPRTQIMISQIADLTYVIVSSETEALILENNFIKQYHPRYNVLLRDDKNYQFIKIDYDSEIPQVYPVRRIETPSSSPPIPAKRRTGGEKQGKYFGPYTSGLSVRRTLKLLGRVFRLCRNKKVGKRPCFAYHLGNCPGVCVGEISLEKYRSDLKQVENFLKFRQSDVLKDLRGQMKREAAKKHFERAAILRDRMRALTHIWERQKIVTPQKVDQDYLGFFQTDREAVINLFLVREGKLTAQEQFHIKHHFSAPEEILENFIIQYYSESSNIPAAIFAPADLPNRAQLEQALKKIHSRGIRIAKPQRGKKAQLVELAAKNARHYFEREQAAFEKNQKDVLEELKNLFGLRSVPKRIEGYDISNIQGTNPAGSMVVFTNGQPDKSQYRKFKINMKQTPDDYAMMREMIDRRFRHVSTSPLPSPGLERVPEGRVRSKRWPTPDLIIIDGGRGQLNAATYVLTTYSLKLPIIGLAKRLEEIYLPHKKKTLRLPGNSPVLQLLQRVRDEAHRFALDYHSRLRSRTQMRSRLDGIRGIGPAARKKLLKKFGSVKRIGDASLDELAGEVGTARARRIKEEI